MKKSIIALALSISLALTTTPVLALTTDYTTTRLGGQDRFDTAIEVSKEFAKNDTITNCIIGNSDNYADNISAAPLSVYKNAPVLLTEKDSLNPKTQQRLADMSIKNVFIVGGVGVVSQNVEDQLKSLGYNVTRFGGKDRIETNRIIMNFIPKDKWGPYVKLVNSYDWVEGLSVAVDCKMVIDGETYINPIFTINPDTSTVADIQDIVESIKPLVSKWQDKYKLTIDESKIINNNVQKRVAANSGSLDQNALMARQSEAMKEMYTCFASSGGTVNSLVFEAYSKFSNDSVWRNWNISNHFSVKPDLEPRYVNYRILHDYNATLLTKYDNFVDALSVAPLSAKLSAPIILVNPSGKPFNKDGYDIFTNVNKVYYIGGTGVIPDGSEKFLSK